MMNEIEFQSSNGPTRMTEKQPERLFRSRHGGGVIWSHDDPVLIIQPSSEKALLWIRGGSVWSGMYGTTYTPGYLMLWQPSINRTGPIIGEDGGRLTRSRVIEHEKIIEEFFGMKINWEKFYIKKTLFVE